MSAKKLPKCTPDPRNKTQASVTLHQGNNCGGSNPANITKRWSGKNLTNRVFLFFCPLFFRST